MGEQGHTEWVSCVRFSPNTASPPIVSAGWDKLLKGWNLSNCKLRTNLVGHTAFINSVIVSPDGSLCASGGRDGVAMLWDIAEGRHLFSLDAADVINALVFSPNRYWLCAATEQGIRVWDLESKKLIVELTKPADEKDAKGRSKPALSDPFFANRDSKLRNPSCVSVAWSDDGSFLYSGWTDNQIRVYEVTSRSVNTVPPKRPDVRQVSQHPPAFVSRASPTAVAAAALSRTGGGPRQCPTAWRRRRGLPRR